MSARPIQLYSGVDSVRAADELAHAIQERRDQWPYVHVYPPPNAEDVHVVAFAVMPNQGTTVQVLQYQVSSGKRFFLQAVLMTVTNAASFVPGAALWTLDRNKQAGVANAQGAVEHGLVNVPFPLGSNLASEPWRLHRAREFEPLNIVRIKGTNVALNPGDPNYFIAGIFGYEVPTLDVKPAK